MQTTKRQHFIPRLHLQHFVGMEPNGQVWTYESLTGNVRSAVPEETAVETHFYSIEEPDGTMNTRIEDFLASVESKAAPVYESLLHNEMPTDPQKRADFADFLAFMYVRTPAMRRMSGEMYSRHIQIMCYAYGSNKNAFNALNKRVEEEGGRVLTAEEKERLRNQFLDPSGYLIEVPKQNTFPILAAAEKLAPIIFRMKWSVLRPSHGFFITTDNPLVREVNPQTRHAIYGDGGFLNKTAEVIFPLSSQRLMLMSWDVNAPDFGVVGRDYVDRVNRGLAAHSDRYIYAHINHKHLKELAAEFKDSRPEMTTQGLGPKKFAKTKVVRRWRK